MKKPTGRAQRINLEQYLPPAAKNPQETVRKVLILSSHKFNTSVQRDVDNLELSKAIGARVSCDSLQTTASIKDAMPRGITWSTFPVVSQPWYIFKPLSKVAFSGGNRDQTRGLGAIMEQLEMNEIIPNYDHYAIEITTREPAQLDVSLEIYKLAYAIKKLGNPEARVFLKVHMNVHRSKSGDWVEVNIDDLLHEHGSYASFMYSYALNFRAIAMKAVRASIDIDRLSQMRLEHEDISETRLDVAELYRLSESSFWRAKEGRDIPWLAHPLSIQTLYLLRKHGPVPKNNSDVSQVNEDAKNAHDVINTFLEYSYGAGPSAHQVVWKGSGKYAAAVMARFVDIGRALFGVGFIDINEDGDLILSQSGHNFLECIHPDCEDPDVLLRWIDPTTGFIRPGSEPFMDDWLMRHFKKMKTRVNKLNSSSVIEVGAQVDPTQSSSYPYEEQELLDRQWFGDME